MRGGVLVWGDVAFYLAVLAIAVAVAPRTKYWVAGIVLAAIAFPLWIAARVQLGSSFSFRAEAHRLVTTGLYAKIRHPVYSSYCRPNASASTRSSLRTRTAVIPPS